MTCLVCVYARKGEGAVKLSRQDAKKLGLKAPPKRSKYGNVKTVVDGFVFHSKREAKRYTELKLLLDQGKIDRLTLQKKFDLIVNGVKICTWKADFTYYDRATRLNVVEDVKGYANDRWAMKKKLMKACYGIDVREI